MKILLKEQVEHLGSAGSIVEVKPGYARNYLIPKDKAVAITRKNMAVIENEVERHKRSAEKRLIHLKEMCGKIADANCTIARQCDENDKLYGSVTPKDISGALKIIGFDVDAKSIQVNESIKSIGVHQVRVKLESNIETDLKVWVVKE